MKKVLMIISIVAMVASLSSAQLAGYWTFDETSGMTAIDSSGHGKDGTLTALDSTNYPTRITGHIGNALLFNTNGSNQNCVTVALNTGDSLKNLGEAFTISMWVRRDALSQYAPLVCTDTYEVDLASTPDSGDLDALDYFYSSDVSWQLGLDEETEEQKVLGSWYHFAVTYDGNYLRKYVNGALVATIDAPQSFSIAATSPLTIASSPLYYYKGALDDVAIWSGKYLVADEVEKLANGTATPLTAIESDEYVPPVYTMETELYPGWAAIWNCDFTWGMAIVDNHPVWNGYWHFEEPNNQEAIVPDKWYVKNDSNYANVPTDAALYGVQWIGSEWNGFIDPNKTVMAGYITPGLVLGQKDWGFDTSFPYFRTNLRISSQNPNGASARISVYKLASDTVPDSANYSTLMTLIGEEIVSLPANHTWNHVELIFPKPVPTSSKLWFEIGIEGGTPDTILFVDSFKPASQLSVNVKSLNYNQDSFIEMGDLGYMTDEWLESADTSLLDPRSGGLLVNGDFSADSSLLSGGADARAYANPTGWTFTGTVAGNYGIQRVNNRGEMNFTWLHTPTLPAVVTPLGGNVAAYLTDKIKKGVTVYEAN